jgi:hypothetical protein
MKPALREPRIPPDERLVELVLEGIGAWFRLHTSEPVSCGCNMMGPDAACDVGHSLWRLSARARAGQLDRHKAVA